MAEIPAGTKVRWMDEDFGPMAGNVAVYYSGIRKYGVDAAPLGRQIVPADVLHSANPKAVVGGFPIQRL